MAGVTIRAGRGPTASQAKRTAHNSLQARRKSFVESQQSTNMKMRGAVVGLRYGSLVLTSPAPNSCARGGQFYRGHNGDNSIEH